MLSSRSEWRDITLCSAVFDMLTQSKVDKALVVPTSSGVNLGTEPFQHFFVQSDRDSGLSMSCGGYGSSLAFAEIVLLRSVTDAPILRLSRARPAN